MSSKYTPEQIREMVYGLKAKVKLDSGEEVFAVNLDNGATTPPLKPVSEEIQKQLLYYGSIGRGTGQKSRHSSEIYSKGRDTVKRFLGAEDDKYDVFYVNCTTDGMNKLASALIDSHRDMILTTRMEHHANDLPWRERARTVYAEVDELGRLRLEDFKDLLDKYTDEETGVCKIKYVAVGAASNVTGYVNEVHKIAALAHKYGAQIIVDGAQIVAHRQFSMIGDAPDGSEDIDFFVFSAHKMYSPYGGGAVVGLKTVLNNRLPVFYGGGMVNRVADDDVDYAPMPDRYEAGSPNYPGVVGMLKAMEILMDEIGFEYIRDHEQVLIKRTLDGLKGIGDVILYGDSEHISDRVGTVVFNLENVDNEDVANMLAGRAAIAVRHAKFCAHTYVDRLLLQGARAVNCTVDHWGMVRVSFGVYNNEDDVDALIKAVRELPRSNIASVFAASKRGFTLPNDRG